MIIYLYVKQHSITKKKYFGKTTVMNPYKYRGSGLHWGRHLRKHGKQHVVTLDIWGFEDQQCCTEFALKFSDENNIVDSDEWANLKPENGKDGWSSEEQYGEDNVKYDFTTYHFVHLDGREEICHRYHLQQKYPDIKQSSLSRLIKRGQGTAAGWRLFGTDIPTNADQVTYQFRHKTGNQFIGKRCDFLQSHPEVNQCNLSKLINHKLKSTAGWKLDV